MSAPMPSPSINGICGQSGVRKRPFSISTGAPAVGIRNLFRHVESPALFFAAVLRGARLAAFFAAVFFAAVFFAGAFLANDFFAAPPARGSKTKLNLPVFGSKANAALKGRRVFLETKPGKVALLPSFSIAANSAAAIARCKIIFGNEKSQTGSDSAAVFSHK